MLSKKEVNKYLKMVASKNMEEIPAHVWEEEKFIVLATPINHETYKYISEEKRNDRKLLLDCFDVGIETLLSREYIDMYRTCEGEIYKVFEYADPKFKADKGLVLEILGYDERIYGVIDQGLQKDMDVLEEYVNSMQAFASESKIPVYNKINQEVLDDMEKMMRLIEIDPLVFLSASKSLRGNLDFVLKAYSLGRKIYDFDIDSLASEIEEDLLKDKDSAKKLLDLDAILYYDVIPFYEGEEKEELILYAIKNAKEQKFTDLVISLKNDLISARLKNKVNNSKIDFIKGSQTTKKNIYKINDNNRKKPTKKPSK